MNPIDGDYVRDEILYGEAYVPDELAAYIKRVFDEAHTIEAEVVKHGKWLGLHDGWYYSYSCSECGAEALTKEGTMHDQVCSTYCPNCGAKMDKEE